MGLIEIGVLQLPQFHKQFKVIAVLDDEKRKTLNVMTVENITFKFNEPLLSVDIINVFISSGIRRPTYDIERISKMFQNSNLVISAWDDNMLIGVSRSLTDFSYCCYLSDLAVKKEYQNIGIGKKLIEITKNYLGETVMLLLLSAPSAMEYYPNIGFERVLNGFIIKRKK